MENCFIGLILLGSILYVIKQWFEYRKVAVQVKGYSKVAAITLLLFAFMAVIGVTSLSEQIIQHIFSSLGWQAPQHFPLKVLLAFLILAVSSVLIMKKESVSIDKKTHKSIENTGIKNVTAQTVNLTQNFNQTEQILAEKPADKNARDSNEQKSATYQKHSLSSYF